QYEMVFYAFVGLLIVSRPLALLVGGWYVWNLATCQGGCEFPRSFLSNGLILLFLLGAAVAWVPKSAFSLRLALGAAITGLRGFLILAASDIAGSPVPASTRSIL